MSAFTRACNSSSFTSRIDSKGRALLSADVRQKLCLKFGSTIVVSVDYEFTTKIDERGRFVVPAAIRKTARFISGNVSVGRGGVIMNV